MYLYKYYVADAIFGRQNAPLMRYRCAPLYSLQLSVVLTLGTGAQYLSQCNGTFASTAALTNFNHLSRSCTDNFGSFAHILCLWNGSPCSNKVEPSETKMRNANCKKYSTIPSLVHNFHASSVFSLSQSSGAYTVRRSMCSFKSHDAQIRRLQHVHIAFTF